jgi:hypothetical protein
MHAKRFKDMDDQTRVILVSIAFILVSVFALAFLLSGLGASSSDTEGEVEMGEDAAEAIARYREAAPPPLDAAADLNNEGLKARAIAAARVLMPGAAQAGETPVPDPRGVTYTIYNDKGDGLGWIHIERATGKIFGLCDFSAKPSSQVNMDLEEAQAIAQEFLRVFGVDMTLLAPSTAELRKSCVTGYPDNPTPLYQYEFTYEPHINGIFVDCPQLGAGCYVHLSPQDGRIMICSLPRTNVTSLPEPPSEIEVTKEEAIEIAREMAREAAVKDIGMARSPKLTEDEMVMRYWLYPNDELVPYWTVTFDLSIGGVSYGISAMDGSMITSACY